MKPIRWLLLLLLALVPVLAHAGDVAFVGPDKMDIGATPIKISITGVTVSQLTGQAKLVWYPRDIGVWEAADWSGSPYVLISPSKAGSHLLSLSVVLGGKLVYIEKEFIVGKVEPDPDPTPDPTPTPGKRWVILLRESQEQGPEMGALVTNESLRQYLKEKGHKWRMLDPNQTPPADLAAYVQLAPRLPYLFLADEEGTICYKGDPPAKADALIDLIKKNGG